VAGPTGGGRSDLWLLWIGSEGYAAEPVRGGAAIRPSWLTWLTGCC